jgi:hypothetical protein
MPGAPTSLEDVVNDAVAQNRGREEIVVTDVGGDMDVEAGETVHVPSDTAEDAGADIDYLVDHISDNLADNDVDKDTVERVTSIASDNVNPVRVDELHPTTDHSSGDPPDPYSMSMKEGLTSEDASPGTAVAGDPTPLQVCMQFFVNLLGKGAQSDVFVDTRNRTFMLCLIVWTLTFVSTIMCAAMALACRWRIYQQLHHLHGPTASKGPSHLQRQQSLHLQRRQTSQML